MKKHYLLSIFLISFLITSTYELLISLDDYHGLRVGSKVIYNQQNIGKVKSIFEENGKYAVTLKIYKEYEITEGNFLFTFDQSSGLSKVIIEENQLNKNDNSVTEEDEERIKWEEEKKQAELEEARIEEEERKKWEEEKKKTELEEKKIKAAEASPFKGDINAIEKFQKFCNIRFL